MHGLAERGDVLQLHLAEYARVHREAGLRLEYEHAEFMRNVAEVARGEAVERAERQHPSARRRRRDIDDLLASSSDDLRGVIVHRANVHTILRRRLRILRLRILLALVALDRHVEQLKRRDETRYERKRDKNMSIEYVSSGSGLSPSSHPCTYLRRQV